MNRLRKPFLCAALLLGAVLLVTILVALPGLSDFDLADHDQRELNFTTPQARLTGTLVRPKGRPAAAVAILVHGDGAQDRFSNGGYLPLMNALLEADVAVYSWDKPGIGGSSGNWLDQSMEDRANEALAALEAVAAETGSIPIGFLGFSQAGWVLPDAVRRSDKAAFVVLVGAAINWRRQGMYYTSRRLEAEGLDAAEIAASVAARQTRDDLLFSSQSVEAGISPPDGMSAERFSFIVRNRDADATAHISEIRLPLLVLYGAEDLNVDPRANAALYRQAIESGHLKSRVTVFPGATHGLLRAWLFNYQLPSQMPALTKAAFVALGRRAYAPGALQYLSDWILGVTREGERQRPEAAGLLPSSEDGGYCGGLRRGVTVPSPSGLAVPASGSLLSPPA